MERVLLAVFCLSGWHICSSGVHQYHYIADPKTWAEAQAHCRHIYTDLATIKNTEDVNQLKSQLNSTLSSAGSSSKIWIGLYSPIRWQWSDGYSTTGADYKGWDITSEPNFFAGNQFCVLFKYHQGWIDYYCKTKYPFVCYKGTQLNRELVFVKQNMDWLHAQRFCREHHSDLATVRNDSENKQVRKLVRDETIAWIGLFREPLFHWSDGSSYAFSYWDGGPNLLGSLSVACGAAALPSSWKWKLLPCETRLPFVCYSVPVRKQIVKLRMKASVDLHDPAVKEGILKKAQDRLREAGVSGVTLRWRGNREEREKRTTDERDDKERRSSEAEVCASVIPG